MSIALLPSVAFAGNDDDVVAGSDVALTGGAVVANVSTGGAMWFNPAGVARLDSRSVGLTGAVLSYAVANAPGILSLSSGEQSNGDTALANRSKCLKHYFVSQSYLGF